MTHVLRAAALALAAGLLAACSGSGTGSASRPTQAPAQARATMPIPSAAAAATASPAIIAIAQQFVDQMAHGDFSSMQSRYDQNLRLQLPPQKLQDSWNALIAQAGAFKRQVETSTQKKQGFDIVSVLCEFDKGYYAMQVVFDTRQQIIGLQSVPDAPYEAPAYVDKSAFAERDVTVGSGEWALPGTLSMPAGKGPFPAVVLVQGSGPLDRDSTILPNRPFRDLAWGLASRGIAVLRYDKRTLVYAARLKDHQDGLTVKEETVDDALAAVALLRATPGIDTRRIYVLGHSLGGMLAPRIAAGDPNIAGFVIMAGLTRPLADTVLDQYEYIASLGDSDPEDAAQAKAQLDQLRAQVAKAKDPSLSPSTPASELPLGVSASYWLDLRGYDPAAAAKNVQRPMLILQGGRDYQVTAADFQGWKDALGARADVEFKSYPKLDHLFIAGDGPITPAEYKKPGHVAAEVIDDIAGWITKG